jgi:hypothetical protein
VPLHTVQLDKTSRRKKTLKSPKLLLNTAWVNSVWDTKEDQSEEENVANG